MSLQQNAFRQVPVQGQIDLQFNPSIISGRVASDEAVPLVAGQAVKLVNDSSQPPTFTTLDADSEAPFGYVTFTAKDINYPALAALEVAMETSVMYMTAGAAIARGAKVEVDVATTKVITNAGVNPVAGFALDKALADGDLIRVYVLTPAYSSQTISDIAGLQAALDSSVKVANVTASLAEINAGKTLIAGVVGKSVEVVSIIERVTGAFTTTTSVDVQSSATAAKISVALVAALTNGAVVQPGDTNVSRGAGYGVVLPSGEGVVVANVGTNAAGGTSIAYTITYRQA